MGKHEEIRQKKPKPEKKDSKKFNNPQSAEGAEVSLDIYSSTKKKGRYKKNGKKKWPWWVKCLISFGVTLAIIFGAFFGLKAYIYSLLNYQHQDIDEQNVGVNTQNSQSHIVNIALFGVDTRKENSVEGLSDSIMILSINKSSRQIKLISILRDTIVDIDGRKAKINSAYSTGGPECAVRTLNRNFNLDIRDFVTVNFERMAQLVDLVGGVNIEVNDGELALINPLIEEQAAITGDKPQYVKNSGYQTLTGMQAVAWARIRKTSTSDGERDDFGRTDRQREVLTQLFNRASGLGLSGMIDLVEEFSPSLVSSLTKDEIWDHLEWAVGGTSLQNARMPIDYSWRIKDIPAGVPSTGLYFDREFARDILKAYIYDGVSFEDYIEEYGISYNPW